MKITPSNVDGFLKNIPKNINSVLIYGPDLGIVKQRSKELSSRIVKDIKDVFSVDNFYYDKIKNNITQIAEAIYGASFFKTRKLIMIADLPNSISPDLINLLENYSADNFIILTASELTPASNIRKLYEKSKNKAVIACYHDEAAALKSFIINYLKAHNLSFSSSIIKQLEENLYKDRMFITSELDKLITYLGINTEITQSDLDMIINEPIDNSIDEFVEHIAYGDIIKINSTLNNLLAENISMVTILRSISRYFMRLYQVKIEVEKGVNETAALKVLSPNLFYKQVPGFLQFVRKWSKHKLVKMLELLVYLEANCKKSNIPANLLCEKLLIEFSCMSR